MRISIRSAILALATSQLLHAADSPKPNIVFILSDDLAQLRLKA